MLFKEDHGGGGGPPAEIVAAPLPPAVVVSASTTTSNDNEQRKTHIEVCIRIRPMLEGSVRESSNGFLLNNNNNNNSASSCSASSNTITANNSNTCTSSTTPSSLLRRSSISRLPSLFRPTSSSSNNTNTPRKQPPEEQNQSPAAAAPPAQYAWKVEEDPDNHGGNASRTTVVRQTMNLVAGRTHQYTLDHVYGPTCHTSDVYQHSVQDLVHAAMDGYHTSVLAYGQTSTGKTHTITGTAAQPGILPRAVRECFDYLNNTNNHHHHSTNNAMGREYLLRVSYLEVYKENIRDLLAITTTPGSAPTPIRLFEAPDQGLIIKGLREQVVTNADQVFALLRQGEARRQIGATHMNQHSSRSHTIVRIWIESRASSSTSSPGDAPSTTGTAPTATASSSSSSSSSLTSAAAASSSSSSTAGASVVGSVRISSLSIVDLAGSESVRLSKDASRQKEGHYINQSLMALGKVVYALSEAATAAEKNPTIMPSKLFASKQQHIPYRDSKLTRLLQPSLSGNAQVVLICCISPLQDHVEESHNTFKFAIRAKKIPQRATIDEVDGDGDGDRASATLLQSYRQEIEDLKQQLKEAREQQNSLLQLQQQQQTQSSSTPGAAILEETDDEVHELVHAIQAMERLILKSKPTSISIGSKTTSQTTTTTISTPVVRSSSAASSRPEDLLDDDDDTDFDQHEGELMALANNVAAVDANATKKQPTTTTTGLVTPVRGRSSGIPMSSTRSTATTTLLQNNSDSNSTLGGGGSNHSSTEHDAQLSRELGRIQSLLGSVLKKRKQQANQQQQQQQQTINSNNSGDEAEVRDLRAKLEQQEISTSLRKADSSFLQQQLQEKDDLLQEVSNILEQLEARQVQLEQENATLKQQLAEARQAQLEQENAHLRQQLAAAVAAAADAQNSFKTSSSVVMDQPRSPQQQQQVTAANEPAAFQLEI